VIHVEKDLKNTTNSGNIKKFIELLKKLMNVTHVEKISNFRLI